MKPPSMPSLRLPISLMLLMIAASVFASVMKPTKFLAQLNPIGNLETVVPMQFGEWRGDSSQGLIQPNPETVELLRTLYTQTLSRTYTDSRGRRIMLAIAYGDDQRDGLRMHYPEVCYPAQGFQNKGKKHISLNTPYGPIKTTRLLMTQGQRLEPITYWTMIGESQSARGLDKKLKEMRYSLKGIIVDGLLFRVSSIGRDTDTAYADQEAFIKDLIDALNPEARRRLAGLQAQSNSNGSMENNNHKEAVE